MPTYSRMILVFWRVHSIPFCGQKPRSPCLFRYPHMRLLRCCRLQRSWEGQAAAVDAVGSSAAGMVLYTQPTRKPATKKFKRSTIGVGRYVCRTTFARKANQVRIEHTAGGNEFDTSDYLWSAGVEGTPRAAWGASRGRRTPRAARAAAGRAQRARRGRTMRT